MKRLFTSLMILNIFIAFTNTIHAQVIQDWASRYNGQENSLDQATSIVVDNSGNVYITGYSVGSGTGYDYATIKYNSSGVQQWVQRYNGTGNGNDTPGSIAIDGSGNVYVTGDSYGDTTARDFATVKYNSLGVQQWVQRYNGPANGSDVPYAIAVDGTGNVYVTGYSRGIGTLDDYTTIKYSSLGVEQWVQRYNGPGNSYDNSWSISVDVSENVCVTGHSMGSETDYDYATIKYNAFGVQQWVHRYNGPGNGYDKPSSIDVDAHGNIYVTGTSKGDGTKYDYATIKYSALGDPVWIQRYNGTGNDDDDAKSIAVSDSGYIYITGTTMGIGTDDDYTTIKYNSEGIRQWVKNYNGPGNNSDYANSIAVGSSYSGEDVYVTGCSLGSGTDYDYATIKYDSSGLQQWVQRYDGPVSSFDRAVSVAIDGSGNVYVTGNSRGSGTDYDYTTIKYTQGFTGIYQTGFTVSDNDSLLQNYPNPFTKTTTITWHSAKSSRQTIKVYDVFGNEVATLADEVRPAGRQSIDFNTEELSAGVYFYQLRADGKVETKKMILIK